MSRHYAASQMKGRIRTVEDATHKEKIFSTPRNPCHVLSQMTDRITKGRGRASSARCRNWARVNEEGAAWPTWGKNHSARDMEVKTPKASIVAFRAKVLVKGPVSIVGLGT